MALFLGHHTFIVTTSWVNDSLKYCMDSLNSVYMFMQVANILSIDSSPLNGRVFDVCLDKGTYDAISLSPSNPEKRKAVYVQSSATLLKASGLLIIASCNWTEEELKKQFEPGSSKSFVAIMYKQKVMQQNLGVVIATHSDGDLSDESFDMIYTCTGRMSLTVIGM